MKDLISVIIPTYKRELELKRAIDSVLNQTYKNIEIIVVDDNGIGSEWQKKSQKIMKNYIKNKNIQYICNKSNLGGALTRNIGIEKSKGKYIAFLDDDDEYYSTKLEKQINVFKKQDNPKLALVYCYSESYDEHNNKLNEYKYEYNGNCLFESMCNCIAATSQWLCIREYLINVNKFSDVPSKQDSTLTIKLLNNGYEIDKVSEILVKYNEHSKERISNGGVKNIEGEEILREFCRGIYNKLSSFQILRVECESSFRLGKLYVKNKIYDKALSEIKILRYLDKKKFIKLLGYYCINKYAKLNKLSIKR